MYIKKSVLSGMIVAIGAFVLLAAAFLFCFTEVAVSRYVYMAVWGVCISLVVRLTKKIERA